MSFDFNTEDGTPDMEEERERERERGDSCELPSGWARGEVSRGRRFRDGRREPIADVGDISNASRRMARFERKDEDGGMMLDPPSIEVHSLRKLSFETRENPSSILASHLEMQGA